MSRATHVRAQARLRRRERLRRQFPLLGNLLRNPVIARQYIELASLSRIIVELGCSAMPDYDVENHDALIALLKDDLGIASLTDAEFEHAARLATPPEFRETAQ